MVYSVCPCPFRLARSLLKFLAATNVFRMSMVTVIGPTPPGTGVMCPATFLTPAIEKKIQNNVRKTATFLD